MTEKKTPQTKRWIKILLAASLGVNLLIGGLIVGAKISGVHHKGAHGGPPVFRILMGALPHDKRKEARLVFTKKRDEIRKGQNGFKQEMESIKSAIAAQPFDQSALSDALDEQRFHMIAKTQSGQDAFVKIISEMDDNERAAYVVRINELRLKHKKRRKEKRKYE